MEILMTRNTNLLMSNTKNIGNRILNSRIANGYSRVQLASMIDVTHQQLQKYETGVNKISADRLALIAKALNKPISFFYEDIEENISDQENTKQRICLEVSRNFSRIENPEHQSAISMLIKSLLKQSV